MYDDGTPRAEYEQRLDKALEIASAADDNDKGADFITVGGIHEGCEDTSLAESGKDYLDQYKSSEWQIFQHDEAMSGYEEDLIAAQHFIDNAKYSEFHVVCSIGQVDRSYLTFISLGIQPIFDPITFLDSKPNHSLVCEQRGSWGVPAFFQEGGNDAVRKASEAIRQRHLAEAERGSTSNEEATADDEPSQDNPDDQDDSNS